MSEGSGRICLCIMNQFSSSLSLTFAHLATPAQEWNEIPHNGRENGRLSSHYRSLSLSLSLSLCLFLSLSLPSLSHSISPSLSSLSVSLCLALCLSLFSDPNALGQHGTDHALIGGVVAVVVFVTLCLIIVLGRYLARHKGNSQLLHCFIES